MSYSSQGVARVLLGLQHWLLGIVSVSLFDRNDASDDPKVILALRTCLLGDFVLSLPSISALRSVFPHTKVVLITPHLSFQIRHAATYVDVTKAMPWFSLVRPGLIDEFLTISSLRWSSISALRNRIAALSIDRCVILTEPSASFWGILKKLFFLRVIGIKCKVYGWKVKANHNVMHEEQYEMGLFEHHIRGPLRAVCSLPGMPPIEEIRVEFPIGEPMSVVEEVDRLWTENHFEGHIVVAVAPGSTQPHKRWPLEKFVQLCVQMSKRRDIRLVVIGTTDHVNLGDKLLETVGVQGLNLAGKTDVVTLAEVLKRVALLVGNDGGSMHLAAAIGQRCVSIISGIEYPGSVEPWGSEELAVYHKVPCAPCYSFSRCPVHHNRCMKDIEVVNVMEKCMLVLDSVPSAIKKPDNQGLEHGH